MANTIKPKRSYTASATPTLAAGELAINATDGKIWLGNAAGTANVLVASLGFADHTGTVAVTQGGTGATTAANARTNLGLAIGSNVQAWDADLDAIAAIVGTSGLLKKTAANTWTLDTTSYGTGTVTSVAAGSYLTGGTITTSGTLAVDATSANTPSKVVARDASGNFSAGAITASSINKVAITAPATSATITVADGKTLTASNTLTFTGTDASSVAFGTGGTVLYSGGALGTPSSGTLTNCTFPTLNQNTTGSSGSCTGNSATATKSTNLIGGNSTTLLGALPYQSNTDTTSLLSPNTTTTKNFLSQTGTGTNGAAPSWSTVSKSDVGLSSVENTALSTWAGTANITTLGTVATGTWNATAIGLSKGGTNASITATNGGIVYSTASALAVTSAGTSGQILQSNGAAAPSWVASPGVPTGSLFPFAGSSAPSGYLLCDGSSISSTNYLALHAVISNIYGGSAYTGGSGLNFNLPDLRGRFPMGAGTGTGLNSSGTGAPSGTAQTARAAGQWGGEETNLLTTNEMPSHSHTGGTGSAGSHYHTFGKPALSYVYPNGTNTVSVPAGTYHRFSDSDGVNDTDTAANHTHSITSEGGGARHNNIPPFVVLNFIIKT